MQTKRGRWASRVAIVAGGLLLAKTAGATGALEFPDNGSEQMGRGGAWVARASDPEATFYNPAGLAGQATGLTVQANVVFDHTCFTRQKASNDPTPNDGVGANGMYPRVCNDVSPTLNPNLAFNYRLNERVGLGVGLFTPSAASSLTFPDFVPGGHGTQIPSPARYLLTSFSGTIVSPTIGFGAEIFDNFRVGASFVWTIANMKLGNASTALNTNDITGDPASNDVKAQVSVKDLFIPGFVAGVLYSPIDQLDIAGWYHYSAPIDASGDLTAQTPYYNSAVAGGNTKSVKNTDTSLSDCGEGDKGGACGPNRAHVVIPVPMEAKLGFRFHKPRHREQAEHDKHLRDPLSQDVFDIEADLTWANDSTIDALQVRLPGDSNQNGVIQVNGTNGYVPPNADSPRHYNDVFGARVGGDYNVIADKLAIRAGGYVESAAMKAEYQNIDFPNGTRIGLALGATYRIHLRRLEADATPLKRASNAIEIMVGYMHSFMLSSTYDGPGGIDAVSGIACNPAGNSVPGPSCSNGAQKNRSNWPINLGTVTNAVNLINLGATYRF